jgi:DNA-binding MurR/RpiR family transcriptional regulator
LETNTMKALSVTAMGRAVQAIRSADRVEVFGIGSAAPIAEDANYRLLRVGIDSRVIVDSHVQSIAATLCTTRSTVLTISHSGSTVETLESTRLAKCRVFLAYRRDGVLQTGSWLPGLMIHNVFK